MMKFYCVTDGNKQFDMFLIVYQLRADNRSFPAAYAAAVDRVKRDMPDAWDRDHVLAHLKKRGWDVISFDYETIQEPLS